MVLLPEQQAVLNLLADLDEFLLPRAALFWGNLLGAVRHGGFVPWDDDLDLLLPRTDVPGLKAFCATRGLGVCQHPGGFLKVFRADGVVCDPDLPWRWPNLDVFPYGLSGGKVWTQFMAEVIRLPASQVLPFRPLLFEGKPRLAPACPLPVLRTLYGDYEVYRIKGYDHRREQPVGADEVVERVNAAYWRQYRPAQPLPPSSFAAVAAAAFARATGPVLDLGSGDGRDARYFREQGLAVEECDPHTASGGDALSVDLSGVRRIYARWLLHTLSARQRKLLLQRLGGLAPATVVCLEFREPADALGLTPVADALRLYFDDRHFRWLVSAEEVLDGVGPQFAVLHQEIGRFSPLPTSNPLLCRLILEKRE